MVKTKEILLKIIDELPESKKGQAIEYLQFLKDRADQDLYLSKIEEREIWKRIKTEERINSEDVTKYLLNDF